MLCSAFSEVRKAVQNNKKQCQARRTGAAQGMFSGRSPFIWLRFLQTFLFFSLSALIVLPRKSL